MTRLNLRTLLSALALLALLGGGVGPAFADAHGAKNPCNPCAAAENPCNPCAAPANPCNPCAAPANPCNPCADKVGKGGSDAPTPPAPRKKPRSY